MLGFGKKKEHTLFAVCDGTVFGLTEVADEVFSKKVLGDGFAQSPENGIIRAPAEGKIAGCAESGHAYCIESETGVEILVHIGIDTVELKGEGFEPRVKEGDKVRAGAVLAEVDLELLREKGYDATVITVITDSERVKAMRAESGAAHGGVSIALRYRLS